jgi:hypothetical protein
MPSLRLSAVCILSLLSAGCGSGGILGSAEGFEYAAATAACGPTDGPAVAIYLAATPVHSLEPSAPYVRIYVPQPLDRLTEQVWTLGGSGSDAQAVYYSSASEYEVATSGRVRVSSVASDGTLEGTADLRFSEAGRIRGEFHAAWITREVLCG